MEGWLSIACHLWEEWGRKGSKKEGKQRGKERERRRKKPTPKPLMFTDPLTFSPIKNKVTVLNNEHTQLDRATQRSHWLRTVESV